MGNKGIEAVSSALMKLKNLKFLQFNICSHDIDYKGAELFFLALSELKSMNCLFLDF